MRTSSTVCLSLIAIALVGCSSGDAPGPVSAQSVAIRDVPAADPFKTPADMPLDGSLITLQLPGMT